MHNDYLLSVLLGIIEGLTEFLPISSTAHLRIAEELLDIPLSSGYWKMYTIVIQLGAVACVPVYFWRRILAVVRTFPKGESGTRNIFTHPLSLTIIAFVVTAIPASLLKSQIGANLENLRVIGSALLLGGAVMWGVDALFGDEATTVTAPVEPAPAPNSAETTVLEYATPPARGKRTDRMEDMTLLQAIWIGACQILSAVFPGTSRSMATIAGGQLAGMTRASALEFSFFLSIPTMFVATLHELMETIYPKPDGEHPLVPIHVDAHGWIVLIIGAVVSFIVAFGVVAWFMSWVRRRGFMPFAVYRIVLGIAVLLYARFLAGAT